MGSAGKLKLTDTYSMGCPTDVVEVEWLGSASWAAFADKSTDEVTVAVCKTVVKLVTVAGAVKEVANCVSEILSCEGSSPECCVP